MIQLEQLQPGAAIRGVVPETTVLVMNAAWFGSEAVELTFKTPTGKVANVLLYRSDEPRLELVEQGRPWSFDGDGALFHLVSEAQRIRLAHLFDPVLAVTKNEILDSLNKPDDFILAIVEFLDGDGHRVHYLRHPFQREPDFGVTSVNYDFAELLVRAEPPR